MKAVNNSRVVYLFLYAWTTFSAECSYKKRYKKKLGRYRFHGDFNVEQ